MRIPVTNNFDKQRVIGVLELSDDVPVSLDTSIAFSFLAMSTTADGKPTDLRVKEAALVYEPARSTAVRKSWPWLVVCTHEPTGTIEVFTCATENDNADEAFQPVRTELVSKYGTSTDWVLQTIRLNFYSERPQARFYKSGSISAVQNIE